MKRSVKVDLSWRAWSLIIGFFILVGFVGLSFAYGGTSPAIHGHSAGEIEGGTSGTGGTTIVSSCMPDYSAGVYLSIGASTGYVVYNAPSDGWFMGTAGQGSDSKSNISINGNLIIDFQDLYGSGGGNTNWAGFSIPVRSGDQIKLFSKVGSSTWAKFYPCLNSGSGSAGSADYVVESWRASDGSSWYRKYNSGWIEQGGFYNGGASTNSQNILLTFPISMNEVVDFSASPIAYSSTTAYGQTVNYVTFTSKNVTVRIMKDVYTNSGYDTIAKFYWNVKGKI